VKLGSLCTGIGGLDLAVEHVLGAELVWCAEIDPAASAVLAHRFPGVPNLGDFRTDHAWEVMQMSTLKEGEDTARAMYAMYQAGSSLQDVGEAFGVTRQSVFMRFKRRGWDMRPLYANRQPSEVFNGVTYTLHPPIGYMRATTGQRQLLHRAVWEHQHQRPVADGWDVHHIDGNRLNNDPSNLQAMPKDEHTRLHAALAEKGGEPGTPTVDVLTAGFP
jgi:hypothetical protein